MEGQREGSPESFRTAEGLSIQHKRLVTMETNWQSVLPPLDLDTDAGVSVDRGDDFVFHPE